MNGKRARRERAAKHRPWRPARTRRAHAGSLSDALEFFGGEPSRRFIRPIEPGEFGPERPDWAPPGATEVEVLQWSDPAGGAVLLETRVALPPSGHGRALCVVEAFVAEAAEAVPHLLPSMTGMGVNLTDDGHIHPMWAYSVTLP
jgi:hypothetical protein